MKKIIFTSIILSLFNYSAVYAGDNKFIPSGSWRGVFLIKENTEVPFNFEVKDNGQVYLINATEHFETGKIKITGDSLFIPLDQFDNVLAFKIEKNALTGVLRKQDGTGTPIPVTAEKKKNYRFTQPKAKPANDFSGTYDIVFKSASGSDEKAVGLFTQQGNKLSATFLRVTGDSRYLEGIVDGNNFYLSTFIGSGPGYYKGSFSADKKLTGEVIYSRGNQEFAGTFNEEAALPDLYSLTYLKQGYTTLDFSFPDINGNKISLKDEKYKNKVVVITITGTWCPNCVDEAAFLAPWYKENKARGIEVIAIHFERQTDSAFLNKVINRFRRKYDIQYDQVVAGTADKQLVAASLPALNSFLAFPTTIFIDKKGNVAKIHTGYTGPATGIHYEQFKKEFDEEIDALLKYQHVVEK